MERRGLQPGELEDGTAIHFKNNCGLDYLKGRSLIVVGKYDINPEWLFWALGMT